MQTWFPHPQDDKLQIHVIFDVCHNDQTYVKPSWGKEGYSAC